MAFDLASLNGTNGFRLDGDVAGGELGRAVASAGDVNGDGFDDLLVGAYFANTNGYTSNGVSYVVFGGSGPQPASIDLGTLNGSNGFRMDGLATYDYSGYSVSGAGDVNGDGIDDIIVGAPRAAPNGNNYAGSSYVVFGSASGFSASVDFAALDGSNGFRIDGLAAYDYSGRSVSSAGDVNGDGIDDFIIGARGADPNGNSGAGSSYVVFGTTAPQSATFDLSTLNGSNGFRIDGVATGDGSGRSVSSAGDVNGDGIDDFIIGASGADPNGNSDAGSSYVVFGSSSGFSSTLSLSSLNGSNGFRIDGVAISDYSGVSVSSAGDVNGDGFADIIVGARRADPNSNASAGSSYVVFGSYDGFSATLDLASLDGDNGFRIDGISTGDQSGLLVSSAGDVNGDGFDDFLIGAPFVDLNGNGNAGTTYLIYGTDAGFDPALDLNDLTFDGSLGTVFGGLASNDRSGTSASAAGDVNGDGYDDIIIGARYADPLGRNAAGSSYIIYGGEGFDETFTGTMANDVINGGAGADTIDGGGGTNRVTFATSSMGVRADLIVGGQTGDAAGDTYANIDNLTGSAFDDILLGDNNINNIIGGRGNDRLLGRNGDDTLLGGIGNDTLLGGAGADILNGGAGIDTVSYFDATSAVAVSLIPDSDLIGDSGIIAPFLGDAVGDVFVGIENLEGTNLATQTDFLEGNNEANVISGFAGNDAILGQGGDDTLFGGTGNDLMAGGLGADLLNGGAGFDVTIYQFAATSVRVDLFFFGQNQGEAAGDVFGDIEGITGGDFNDVLLGNGVDNVLTGLDGNDRLFGRGGADTLEGGLGADRLAGGFGGATASDGAADIFVLREIAHSTVSGLGRDTIIDFWRADGDRVDLSSIDAIAGGADDAFTFIGNVGFSGVAGQLRYAAPINQIQGDVDGDGAADFAIVVDNVANMIASDFIL